MQVYISFDDRDTELARRIGLYLRDVGFEVWDRTQIYFGDNPGDDIARALRESEAMVVLITPHSLGSTLMKLEVSYALAESRYAWKVVPVFLCDPSQLPNLDFHPVLRSLQSIVLDDDDHLPDFERIAELIRRAESPAQPHPQSVATE